MAKVIFVQPFTVNAELAEKADGRVVVLDVAFNSGRGSQEEPQQQFASTTGAFINVLGDRLALWLDHHPHRAWSDYENDPRFLLYSRDVAPACPPLITPEIVRSVREVDTIVCHGDFDGVFSAVKWLLDGIEAYPGADADSIAADSRIGTLSLDGQMYENAMKSNLRDDSLRYDVVTVNVAANEDYEDAMTRIHQAAHAYEAVQAETQRLASQFSVSGKVAWLDTTGSETPYDLTQLLLAGQRIAQVALIRKESLDQTHGTHQITIAGPATWDFVALFGLSGGMPNRINLPDQDIEPLIQAINEA